MTEKDSEASMKQLIFLAIVLAFTCALIGEVQGNSGDLDPLFDLDGKLTTDFDPSPADSFDSGFGVVVQPDGKIVLGGRGFGADFGLVRYNTNGTLDVLFDSDGIVTTDLNGAVDEIFDIALQQDGKIVAVGYSTVNGKLDTAVVRYNPNGSLDPTFGSGGKVVTDVRGNDVATSVAIQADGKIVVGGIAFGDTPSGTTDDCMMVRYNPNGTLDPTFDADGIVLTDLGGLDQIADIAIQTDQKIVAAGTKVVDFLVIRYNTTGSLDPAFGTAGIVITDFGANETGSAILFQTDGKIVVGGYASSNSDFLLARYNFNGSLDPTFDVDGKVNSDFGDHAGILDLAIQPDGHIVAAGFFGLGFAVNFGVARYNFTGSLDPTFGTAGFVSTDFGNADQARALALQSDGKIVLAGISNLDFAVARYEGTIILDPCNLYNEDFEDGVLATDWTYVKPSWSESGGFLVGSPSGRKAEAIATPAFAGCGTGPCTMKSAMQTAGGAGNKVWFLAWYQDKQNVVEIVMNQENNKWLIRQRSNGVIVAKAKASLTIQPNVTYDVKVDFDGTRFTLFVDGVSIVSMNAAVQPSGTFGYRVKNTTASFGSVCIN
jgi:uncharacterized delta-60 repeat protein